ncbi:MAG: IS66 family insertion sequence element accessory protein TnpB [Myxococcales bacterium]|nr:IS66 family insertion sequence element accessory protein TnpB [Myxococcales bacterium]
MARPAADGLPASCGTEAGAPKIVQLAFCVRGRPLLGGNDVYVFFYRAPCEMRKQMDGLSTLVREAIKRDPRDGELYLFRNRNRSMIKILFYDHGGYCLLARRLCKGRFRIEVEEADGATHVTLSKQDLADLLSRQQFRIGPKTHPKGHSIRSKEQWRVLLLHKAP